MEVVIVGAGAVTSVGLTLRECAASVRSGVSRFSSCAWLDGNDAPYILAQLSNDGLPPLREELGGFVLPEREERVLRLAATAFAECVAPLAGRQVRAGLVVALPEPPLKFLHGTSTFLRLATFQAHASALIQSISVVSAGRSGGLIALGRAAGELVAGRIQFVVAGGVDSYRDVEILQSLDGEGRLKRKRNLDGFIPGEGAGFVLLTTRGVATANRLHVLACLGTVSEGAEVGHIYGHEPYLGEGLADTLRIFLQRSQLSPCEEVYSTMNGESFWAKEWSVAFVRNRAAFAPNYRMHHPADCFGDLGAAAAPVLVGLAIDGIASKYRGSPCLICASSDRAERAITAVWADKEY